MKKLFLLSAIAVSGLIYSSADAQIRVGLGIGFAPQRAIYATYQAPAYAGDGDEYYYLPDLGVYYNVTDRCYVYFDGSEWISVASLPGQYSDYDWTTARRFEINAFRPYLHDDVYYSRYNGHRFEGWGRPNNYDRDGYANRGYRNADRDFDRDHDRYNQPAQYNRNNDHSFDRNRGAFNQPVQDRRDNNEGFDNRGQSFNRQPIQQNRDNNQGFDNRGRGNDNRQKDQNRGQDNKGGNDRFAKNNDGPANHRMAKF